MNEIEIIHRLIDIFEKKKNYQEKSSGLLSRDMFILERLYLIGSIRVLELARRVDIPPSTMTGILNRLEKANLLKRERQLGDRKAVELIITGAGKEIIEQHLNEDKLFAENFFGVLKGKERENLKELLDKLVKKIDIRDIFNVT